MPLLWIIGISFAAILLLALLDRLIRPKSRIAQLLIGAAAIVLFVIMVGAIAATGVV